MTPYVLLGFLALATGLGVGLGLSEAPTYRTGWLAYGPDSIAVTVVHSPDGILTGVAAPCVGLATTAEYARLPVEVAVNEGSRTVVSETVTGRHTYRFTVPPGRYTISSDEFQAPLNVRVVLHSGKTDHVDLMPACK